MDVLCCQVVVPSVGTISTPTNGLRNQEVGSITYERLKDIVLVENKWERLEKYLKEYLELPEGKDVPIAREMVFNAGEGFMNNGTCRTTAVF